MILTCPHCQTSYDLDAVSGQAGKFLCRRCRTPFPAVPGNGGNGHRPATVPDRDPAGDSAPGDLHAIVAVEPGEFRDLLCRILKSRSVSIRVTASGEEALAWVRREPPDLLFAAVFLRRLLGISLCERVRELAGAARVRVALMGHARNPVPGGNGASGRWGEDFYLEDHLGEAALAARLEDFLRDPSQSGPVTRVPVPDGGPSARGSGIPEETEREICKLGRIAAEDLVLYNPAKASACHDLEKIETLFALEIRQGKALVKERFPGIPQACDIFLRALKENLLSAETGTTPPTDSSG